VRAANTDIATVPTAAEIGGNFSGLLGSQVGTDALGRPVYQGEIFDPASTTMVNGNVVRNPFQGNIIPASRLDSIAHNAAALYPAPTVAGATANNYNFNAPGKDTIDQMDARVDYNISNRQQIFGRFSLSQRTRFQSPPLPGLADGGNYSTGNYFEGTPAQPSVTRSPLARRW
jgi:hypothetical protein